MKKLQNKKYEKLQNTKYEKKIKNWKIKKEWRMQYFTWRLEI